MQTRRVEHTFECSPETFWKEVFFDPEYNTKLFMERLNFERWVVIEQQETEAGFRRVVEAVPRVGDLPGPIKSLLGNGAGYREEGEYSRAESRYRLKVIPNSLPDKLVVTGDMQVVPAGDGRCRRSYDAAVNAKVFGVGSLLERRILDDWEKSFRKAAEFTNEWLAKRAASAPRP